MGLFFLGSVQHGRDRIFDWLSHFCRFWRQISQSSSKMMNSLLEFERFQRSLRHCGTSCTNDGSSPSSKSTLRREEAAKSLKNQQFWYVLLPSLLRLCLHWFYRPPKKLTHSRFCFGVIFSISEGTESLCDKNHILNNIVSKQTLNSSRLYGQLVPPFFRRSIANSIDCCCV